MHGFLADSDLSLPPIEMAKEKYLASGKKLLDLSCSNPTLHGQLFPAEILELAASDYWKNRSYHPDPQGQLSARKSIADYYRKRIPGIDIKPEQIFITASTSEAYRLLLSLLCDPGDNILSPKIQYPLFEHFAADYRIDLHPYLLDADKNWSISERQPNNLLNKHTRGVFIVSPHNPTGNIHNSKLDWLANTKLPLICDEVFAEFVEPNHSAPPVSLLYPEQPVFLLNGISKMFALPDLKLGWIVLNDPATELFANRLAILNDAYLSANSLTQFILPQIFSAGEQFKNRYVKQINNNIRLVIDLLSANPKTQVSAPQGGVHLLLKIIQEQIEERLIIRLIEKGVYCHPGYFFGMDQGCYLVISCVPDKDILLAGLKILLDTI